MSTFTRGAEWRCRRLTLSADGTLPRSAPPPIRALVVTGGHEYATTFYTVFEGMDDLHWEHALSNHAHSKLTFAMSTTCWCSTIFPRN